MPHDHITTAEQLRDYCDWLADASVICFDTEFVSENTYRPQLCLVQVAAHLPGESRDEARLTVIDPLGIPDLNMFWEVLCAPGHETIVHAGREELLFCLRAIGRSPEPWFDVQIAAGLVGYEFPAGYGNLLMRVLNQTAKKGETRTNWAHRPLTQQQIAYALDDVRYLEAVHAALVKRLEKLERTHWMEAEMSDWKQRVGQSLTNRNWRRVAGSASLSSRSLAIVRELWSWREEQAQQQDKPPRRVLRDDLIVELARRRTSDAKRIQAVRGFERRDFRQLVPELSKRIEAALNLPDDECPKSLPRDTTTKRAMLGQFLTSALSSICGAAHISPGIVGNPSDVRDLIALRLDERSPSAPKPALTIGWRAEVVGKTLDDLLQGKRSIRIVDPKSDHPLAFESNDRD